MIAPDEALLLGGFQNGRLYVNDIYIINFTNMVSLYMHLQSLII